MRVALLCQALFAFRLGVCLRQTLLFLISAKITKQFSSRNADLKSMAPEIFIAFP